MKKFLSIFTVVMLIAGIAVFAGSCGESKSEVKAENNNTGTTSSDKTEIQINLNDYLVVSFYGLDGEGTAEYGFDSMSFVDDCSDIIAYKDSEPSTSAAMSLAEYLVEGGSFDVSEGLSNGDRVVFVWNLDSDELKDEYVMNFSYKDAEYIVEDLLMAELPEDDSAVNEEVTEPDVGTQDDQTEGSE